MSFKWIWLLLIAALSLPVAPSEVKADDSGFAYMHDLRRERGRLCMTDHWHSGNGTGRSKASARRAAIRSWQDFTNFEYGTDWARFSRARSKRIRCTRSGGKSYDCSVEARPCRNR